MDRKDLQLEISRSEIDHLKAQVDNLKAQTVSLKKPFWMSAQFWAIISGIVIACIGYVGTWQSQAAKDMNALVQAQLASTRERLSQTEAELKTGERELAELAEQKQRITRENRDLKEFNDLLKNLTLENRERISELILNEIVESRQYLKNKLIDKDEKLGPQDIGEAFAYIITKALIYREFEVRQEINNNLKK